MSAHATRRSSAAGETGVSAAVLVLALVGWTLSIARMTGMDAGPSAELGPLGWFALSWLVMMCAMMLPAMAPIAARCAGACEDRPAFAARALTAAAFLGGYLLVWAAAGVAAYGVLQAGRALFGDLFAWDRAGPWLAALVLAAAAAYQLTARKRGLLARCRDPRALLAGPAAAGPARAGRTGLRAGLCCLGSSGALMAALFALGAMSLLWMALLTLLLAAERLAPHATPGRVVTAAILLALALGVALAPTRVPGLTLPDSPAAMRAMTRMSGDTHRAAMTRVHGTRHAAVTRMRGARR
jgi:predicted metal-binding membrane protein